MKNFLKGFIACLALLLVMAGLIAGGYALAQTSTAVTRTPINFSGHQAGHKLWLLGGDTAGLIDGTTESAVANIAGNPVSSCTIYNNAGTATVKIWYGRTSTDSPPVTYWADELSVNMTSATQETYGMEPLDGDSLKIEVSACSSCKVRAVCYVHNR